MNSMAVYKESLEKIELFSKYFYIADFVSLAFMVFTPLPYTAVRYYIFDMDEESYYLFTPAWFVFPINRHDAQPLIPQIDKRIRFIFDCTRYPFDWRTPFGYLIAFIAEYAGALTGVCVYMQVLVLVFGTSYLFIIIAEDITQDLAALDIAAQSSDGNRDAKLMKYFCDLVEIYSDTKQ